MGLGGGLSAFRMSRHGFPVLIGVLTVGTFILRFSQIHQSLLGDEVFTFQDLHGRSFFQVLNFIAKGIHTTPEFDVSPRTSGIEPEPAATLKINETDSPPAGDLPTTYYEGHYFSLK